MTSHIAREMADGYSSEELFDSLTPIRTSCSSDDEDSPIPLKPLDMSVLFAAKGKGVKRAYTGTFRKASSAQKERGVNQVVNYKKPRQVHSAEPTNQGKQSQPTNLTPKSRFGAV